VVVVLFTVSYQSQVGFVDLRYDPNFPEIQSVSDLIDLRLSSGDRIALDRLHRLG
jgi:hypothetical protein